MPALRSSSTLFKALGLVFALGVAWRLFLFSKPVVFDGDHSLPPLYPQLQLKEANLPQHNENLPFPEGENGRYLRFQNQMWGVGFNNQLQETLLNTHIAHLSNRAYVFMPFTWDLSSDPYVPIGSNSHLASGTVRPARTPLTAYLAGPTVGASWPAGDPTPRAIHAKWWDHICPEEEQTHIDPAVINPLIGVDLDHDEGSVIVERWSKYLLGLEDRCVNIKWETTRIIDFPLLGSSRLVSLWPTYSKSPVLTLFKWSDIVLSAVENNIGYFFLPPSRVQWPRMSWFKSSRSSETVPGLITLHLRRGDYKSHCEYMSTFAEFEGWNKLPMLPDTWNPPSSKEDRTAYALNRCWIEIPAIIARLDLLRAQHAGLERVFLSTNGEEAWIAELKSRLLERGWRSVVSTRDLRLTWEQTGVDNAIDMELASRGQVFVSNGFSSFSSTVVRLRLIRGMLANDTRLW